MNFAMLNLKILIIFTTIFTVASKAQTSPPGHPIARVGSEPIYDQDLTDLIGFQLWQLRTQQYDLQSSALEFLINQKLLDGEAKNNGVSAEALLEQTVYKGLPVPTAGEVEAYYLAQRGSINRPLSEVRSQLEKALLQARRQQARQNY